MYRILCKVIGTLWRSYISRTWTRGIEQCSYHRTIRALVASGCFCPSFRLFTKYCCCAEFGYCFERERSCPIQARLLSISPHRSPWMRGVLCATAHLPAFHRRDCTRDGRCALRFSVDL